MVYIEKLKLPSLDNDIYDDHYGLNCYRSYYPFHVLSHQGLFEVSFSDVTLFTGGNGTGKSTLLNVIAQNLHLRRPTPFNHTELFDNYIALCSIERSHSGWQMGKEISEYGRIITSDEVFDHMIDTRLQNDNIDEARQDMLEKIELLREEAYPINNAKAFKVNLEDPKDIRTFLDRGEAVRKSKSRYIKDHLGFNVLERSNGENAFKYFTEAMKPEGLYLLDEPENSLSAQRQIDLRDYILSMAQYERCQFIISTHSPFLMSMKNARIYNLDVYPTTVMPWTEVETVKVYREFFLNQKD